MNIYMMIKLRDYLLTEESEFDMKCWFSTEPDYSEEEKISVDELISCGTPACLAGTLVALEYPGCVLTTYGSDLLNRDTMYRVGYVGEIAARLLDLEDEESYALFHANDWPQWVREIIQRDGERAGAIALINAMIETGSTDILFG